MSSTRSSADSHDAPLPITDKAILEKRGPRNTIDPYRAYAVFVESERMRNGSIEDVTTILISNRECPFTCLMCDLWMNTTTETVPEGAIASQIRHALETLPPTKHIKLYNAGSFFDPNAIPPSEYEEIASILKGYQTIIVEAHPRMVNQRCFAFSELLEGNLEVAIGLETIDPEVLPRLNKQMSLTDFDEAVGKLRQHNIEVRTFILIRAPYQTEHEGMYWAKASIDHAQSIGIECCCVIPTRAGNGIMDELARRGEFASPSLCSVEDVLDYGVSKQAGRVFVDTWDLNASTACNHCCNERIKRLERMNVTQQIQPRIQCRECSV